MSKSFTTRESREEKLSSDEEDDISGISNFLKLWHQGSRHQHKVHRRGDIAVPEILTLVGDLSENLTDLEKEQRKKGQQREERGHLFYSCKSKKMRILFV